MKRVKKIISWILIIFLGYLLISRRTYILVQLNYYLNGNTYDDIIVNEYNRNYDFAFVQNTDDFIPTSRQDLLNIYYSVINSGNNSYTFLCPMEYTDCLEEVEFLAGDNKIISTINNFVHPFNSFEMIETSYDNLGNVTINVVKNYSADEIDKINKEIDRLIPLLVNDGYSNYDNIKNIHDYIINNTKYDIDRTDLGIINYQSHLAYGPLFEGYAICGGYTDLMYLFLERMDIKSYKVASETHTWNGLLLDNKWVHLDLTWDDPVTSTSVDVMIDDYFMLSTDELFEKEPKEHNFNPNYYRELK